MKLKTAVGGENFAVLRRTGGYYVDKTELLYDLIEANNTVTLFTRPRRFGKTLTLRMIESFFSIFVNDSCDLFDGLAIQKHVEFCAENMNQYPTVFISLKDVEGRTFEVAYGMLKTIIADVCKQYGFTRAEVSDLLAAFGLSDKAEIMKNWYDGYLFGNTKVYCPWDVVYYVSDLMDNPDASPENYWENTSGNGAIKAFFDLEGVDISDKFEMLMNGGAITEMVTNALTYDMAYESEENLWSVLLMTGYVTAIKQKKERTESRFEVELRIPNKEIAGIFQSSVVNHFNQSIDDTKQRELMRALWDGNEEKASEILSDFLWHTISYMDYHEDYYHAFTAGLFTGRGGYAVTTNKERGLGRPDIDLRDKKNRRAIIIEAKKSESEERLEYWCNEALRQIVDKQYARDMTGYRQVLCYGIAFYRKTALVKKL